MESSVSANQKDPGPELEARSRTVSLVRDYLEGKDPARRERAFARLYELHADRVLRSVERQLGRRLREWIAPADILQDAFVDAWKQLRCHGYRKYETVGRFGRLVARIASNKICDYADQRAAEKRGQDFAVPMDDSQLQIASKQARPSQDLHASELEQRIEDAVLRMKEQDRQILDCCSFHGLRHSEAAEELGITTAAAKLRHISARRRLLRLLPADYATAMKRRLV